MLAHYGDVARFGDVARRQSVPLPLLSPFLLCSLLPLLSALCSTLPDQQCAFNATVKRVDLTPTLRLYPL